MASRQRRAVHHLGGTLLFGALLLSAVGFARAVAQYRILEDDRPAIRVRGGSIIFEIDPMGRPGRAVWKKDRTRDEWKPAQSDASSTAFYRVTTTPDGVCRSTEMSGTQVEVDVNDGGAVRTFRFKIRKKQPFGEREPKLEPRSGTRLEIREDGRVLGGPADGDLRELRVEGYDPCTLPAGTQVIVQPRRKY